MGAVERAPVRIRVHYPLATGERLLLRTDRDWERSLPPRRVARDRTRFDFELPPRAPYRYFKPILEGGAQDGSGPRWSQGDDFLVLGDARAPLDVYPYFAPDSNCHVCTAQKLPASVANRGYEVRVFLPKGYDENTLQRFPVLYMQDGRNLFFPDQAAYGQHWRVPETLAVLESMCLVRRTIVVGIHPVDRTQQYTQPGYEAYGRFLVDELKPWVDARYRTLAGPEHTLVMGSSLGGVVSFYLAWEHPRVFGGVAALSSTFGYQDDLLTRVLCEERRPLRMYLDSGWPRDNYEATRNMLSALTRRGYRRGHDFLHLAFPEARHDEQSWGARLHVPLQFLLPA